MRPVSFVACASASSQVSAISRHRRARPQARRLVEAALRIDLPAASIIIMTMSRAAAMLDEHELRRALDQSESDLVAGRVQPVDEVLSDIHRRLTVRVADRQRQLPAAE